ncbi:HlyD family efflux transporter periplasmic adaptor subunit [Galbibacter sp. EGI 63066]|uniref:HlyD family secretion protein n=1 Tax=Galbibacter sp. EGI 63066 TaxID=2993559 RepID=UPI002248ECA7|nr:HlyD family secretion protein [Galbibacter sp. EGI 63066]MCX2678490.1 HlyD family efflux transporter periplasmic adaptor subunit [Galbibacter sp. EGI 63066]
MPRTRPTEEFNIRSEEVQEILTKPPAWIVRWGITLIFFFTIIILTLSFIIKYPDFVVAKVVITTKQPTEKVVARYSGQLDKVLINNKDTVEVNQELALIKNTARYRDIKALKKIIDSAQYDIRSFTFPINITSRFILGEIEPTYIAFEKSYIDYSLFKELNPYDSQLSGNKSSLNEVKVRLKSQANQRDILEQELKFKEKEISRYRKLHKRGVISQQEYESKELEFLQMQKSLNNMTISISQMREAISSADQTLKSTYINKSEDDTKFLKNLLQSFNSLKRAIRDWEYKYVLSSSIEGIISYQEFWGTHQQVNSGDVVFSILPSNRDDLIGKLTIPSQNAGKVKIGQKVLVKLDNYSYQQYGMLVGNVDNMSVSPDEEGNYIVFINLPNGMKTSYNKNLVFNQELLGSAEIITEDLSVAERFFYKFKDLFKY